MTLSLIEIQRLRTLAALWREVAEGPTMQERRRQWAALRELRSERPMIYVETDTIIDLVLDAELRCTHPGLRRIERQMLAALRHAGQVGDDFALEPFFPLPWSVSETDYGVPLTAWTAPAENGTTLAQRFNHPVQDRCSADRVHPRAFFLNREASVGLQQVVGGLFGDLLPVRLQVPSLFAGLTVELFKLAGVQLYLWPYDAPEVVHRLMGILLEDRRGYFRMLEREGLLDRSWVATDSQETSQVSPEMFAEFFLPYMAEAVRPFERVYWGCCEPLHDRLPMIEQAVPNLRAVSVSAWSDLEAMGEMIGSKYLYSRKPATCYLAGPAVYWQEAEADMRRTLAAARGCALEFRLNDVYLLGKERDRLSRWCGMVRRCPQYI